MRTIMGTVIHMTTATGMDIITTITAMTTGMITIIIPIRMQIIRLGQNLC